MKQQSHGAGANVTCAFMGPTFTIHQRVNRYW